MTGTEGSPQRWITQKRNARRMAWVWVGLAAAAGTALRELSLLLGAIESSGGQSYSMTVLTRPSLQFWTGAADVVNAVEVWGADARSPWWVGSYLVIEVLFFAPALCGALYLLMGAVGVPRPRALLYSMLTWLVIALRAGVTGVALCAAPGLYWAIRPLCTLAWGVVLVVLVLIVAFWAARQVDGPASAERAINIAHLERTGAAESPAIGVRWLLLVVGVFLAFIALPAGGPLEQLPDVLRAQLSPPYRIVPAATAVGFLAVALVIGGWRATPPRLTGTDPTSMGRRLLLLVVGLPAALAVVAFLAGSGSWYGALVLPGLLGALALADWLRQRALQTEDSWLDRLLALLVRPIVVVRSWVAGRLSRYRWWPLFGRSATGTDTPASSGQARPLLDDGQRTREAIQPATEAQPAPTDNPLPGGPSASVGDQQRAGLRRLWLGGLAGAVVAGTGIGLIRAALRPVMVDLDLPDPTWWLWVLCAVAGVLLAVCGGVASQGVVNRFLEKHPAPGRGFPMAFFVLVAALCLGLAVWPRAAAWLGSSGTFALCLALVVLLVGELQHLSRTRPAWKVTRELGLGQHTPWLGIVVVAGLFAGLLTNGGYHEVRVVSAAPNLSPTYPDIQEAWQQWRRTVQTIPGCVSDDGSLPMVIVAAPGGGIRASYWTASALDRLVAADPCGRAKIFAISAVSGGALGAVTWVQAPDGQATTRIRTLAEDSALAATTAALFLRDLPRPLTGFDQPWPDRAAVMEDAWAAAAPDLFGEPGAPRGWSQLRSPQGWTPAVVLNGSSVTDGCRVLVTNVGQLPTATPDCRSATLTSAQGPAVGSLDATHGLAAGLPGDGKPCTPDASSRHGDVGILGAALLSARFPVVSPSGILRRCLPTSGTDGTVLTTIDVDGGYFDNSGLLSALAIWSAIEAELRSCGGGCPAVRPRIVVLDNHYRSTTVRPPDSEQAELMIPLQAYTAALETTSQERLEQVAWVAMDSYSTSTTRPAGVDRISPQNGPGISAPLGWVLSPATQADLDRQLEKAFDCADGQSPQQLIPRPPTQVECLPEERR